MTKKKTKKVSEPKEPKVFKGIILKATTEPASISISEAAQETAGGDETKIYGAISYDVLTVGKIGGKGARRIILDDKWEAYKEKHKK